MVDRFIWTEHAASRAAERALSRFDVQTVIREGHDIRERNPGLGDWWVRGRTADRRSIVVVYDHPVFADEEFGSNRHGLALAQPTASPIAKRKRGLSLESMSERFAYYDRDADIAWLPTGKSDDVVSEEVSWGLIDHDAASDDVVGIEIWSAR